MNSRNHHMFASVGGWLYEDVLGLGQARSFASFDPTDVRASGFRHAIVFPRATGHEAVPFASGSYHSIVGPFEVTWQTLGEGGEPCAADAPENAPVTLACPGGGIITGVTFASFGTPTGTCASGFTKGSCDAANSTAIVAATCVGKPSCVINVADTVFGDPVSNRAKNKPARRLRPQPEMRQTHDPLPNPNSALTCSRNSTLPLRAACRSLAPSSSR
jgi:hypothetical protein